MTERDTAEAQEFQYANELLAWFQSNEVQQPRLLALNARQRFDAVGISPERFGGLKAALLVAEEAEQVALWLHFSGFEDELVDQLLDGNSGGRIKNGLELLKAQNPSLFNEKKPRTAAVRPVEPLARSTTLPSRNPRAMGAIAAGTFDSEDDENPPVFLTSVAPDKIDDDDPAPQLGERLASTDLVKVYFQEIGKVPLLTAEDEVRLSKMIEAGLYAQHLLDASDETETNSDISNAELATVIQEGKLAKERMIQANLRLVVSLARKRNYQGKGLELLDLISEGNFGLIRAVEKFDYTKGFKFSTYATWWIKQSLSQAIANTGGAIRLPVHVQETFNRVMAVRSKMTLQAGDAPSIEDLAEECRLPKAKVLEFLNYARGVTSLDQLLTDRKGNQGDTTLGDLLAAQPDFVDDILHDSAVKKAVEGALSFLDPRTAQMMSMRYGLGESKEAATLEEIGKAYGLTRERIRQILDMATVRIRSTAKKSGFDEEISELIKNDQ